MKEKEVKHNVLKNSLEDIMADRFARYSKYIIQERALPDARDGLKPVQRRILYAMYEDGNTYNKPYHKSAKTVGNVIGNYHPHGDSSVYYAMVRMSQNWKITNPLIDMQGNNGSIDDDPAAAMRYTEARLARISDFLLQDIDKDTVEWAPNFSDEKMEPTVLPARFPNLLVNGITGIAAGYATNIPPHNLNEVIQASIYRISHPDCSLEELMQFVKGPDFPTGGIVMGLDGIKQAFQTGRGRVLIRSKVEVVPLRTIKQIIIHEIPYEVIKSNLVKKIDEIRLNKKIDGILDVRDESDRTGLRIVVDLKKDSNDEQILNYLYKNTDLQISYNYNVIAIVNKAPVQMSLAMMLDAFISHREDVVIRRSKYDLSAKKERAHILEGLIKAVSVMDEIIHIIRKSKDKSHAKKNLIERFDFTEKQAEAIVVMRLYRLTNTDVKELKAEFKQLQSDIAELEKIIRDKSELHKVMVEELEKVNAEFNTPRLSKIVHEVKEIVIDEKAMISKEECMITVTRDGYIKRVSMRSYNASSDSMTQRKDTDSLVCYGASHTLQTLIFFTNRGTYGYIPVYQIEEAKWKDLGNHISNYIKMDSSEKIIAAYVLDAFKTGVHVVSASRHGMIKRTELKGFEVSRSNKTMTCMKIGAMDEMISVSLSYKPDDQVILVSEQGYGLMYPVEQIPLVSNKSKGVKAMNLAKDDCVASICIRKNRDEQVLISTTTLSLKRMKQLEIAPLNRPAKGNRICKLVKSNPNVIFNLQMVDLNTKIEIYTDEILTFEAKEVSLMNAQSTFSMPYGKVESFEWICPLENVLDGSWVKQEDFKQPSLFEENNA